MKYNIGDKVSVRKVFSYLFPKVEVFTVVDDLGRDLYTLSPGRLDGNPRVGGWCLDLVEKGTSVEDLLKEQRHQFIKSVMDYGQGCDSGKQEFLRWAGLLDEKRKALVLTVSLELTEEGSNTSTEDLVQIVGDHLDRLRDEFVYGSAFHDPSSVKIVDATEFFGDVHHPKGFEPN